MNGLSYHGQIYRVTHTVVEKVGSKIGTISYHGGNAGVFNLYRIPDHSVRQEIAVQAQQGFLEAVAVKESH